MLTASVRAHYNANMSPPVFRFAPSPNGYLHLGHALSALVTRETARRFNGRFLLRIEDIDITRCHPEYETAIFEDLAWLGLDWEEPVRRQSEHFDTYRGALAKLEAMNLLYPCFASRREIAESAAPGRTDPDGAPLYPGLHKGLTEDEAAARKAAGEPFALRLDMERAIETARRMRAWPLAFTAFDPESGARETVTCDPARWGDAVIARKDVPTSYHLAVVVDDALQGITHVTRGLDLLAATDIHRLLQALLELPQPEYHHHRLLTGGEGRKLSKSDRVKSLKSLRAEGVTPSEVKRLAGLA
mgnify:CR=1 FL=1